MNNNYGGYYGSFNNEFFDDSDMSKFYGGIFMNPESRRPLTEQDKREAKGIVMKTHFGIVIYLSVCYAAIFILSLVFNLFLGDISAQFLENATLLALFNQLMNAIPQYVIAFPVILLFLRNVRVTKRNEKSTLSFKEFFSMLCIAEFLMIVGNLIGTSLNMTVEMFTGGVVDNAVAEMIESTPIWLLLIFVVILAPIFEELIFRKLLMDRLLVLGDKAAILMSAIAFGAFHGNLYQFFYATFVGLVFGYVYAKTRRVIYPIILHALVNFLGSVVAIPVIKAEEKLFEMLELVEANPNADLTPYGIPMLITTAYSVVQYTLIGFGVFYFIRMLKRRKTLFARGEITLDKPTYMNVIFKNPGVIVFYALCATIMIINLIPTIVPQPIDPEVIPDGTEALYNLFRRFI